MSNINPWKADNLQPFWYLNCPECTFKVKEENLFQDHAVKKHPLSSVLFGDKIETESVFIKVEPHEDSTENQEVDPMGTTENQDVHKDIDENVLNSKKTMLKRSIDKVDTSLAIEIPSKMIKSEAQCLGRKLKD